MTSEERPPIPATWSLVSRSGYVAARCEGSFISGRRDASLTIWIPKGEARDVAVNADRQGPFVIGDTWLWVTEVMIPLGHFGYPAGGD